MMVDYMSEKKLHSKKENSMDLQKDEILKLKGELLVTVRDEKGNIKEEFKVPNLVVTAGKVYIASRITSGSTTVMSHMAIGTGTATPAVANTTLGTEAGRVSLASFSASSNTVTATATFPAGTGTGAITEAGIFNASSSGTMLCRTTFPVVNKAAGDSIAITWVVTVS
jgi:hypothetical protein